MILGGEGEGGKIQFSKSALAVIINDNDGIDETIYEIVNSSKNIIRT